MFYRSDRLFVAREPHSTLLLAVAHVFRRRSFSAARALSCTEIKRHKMTHRGSMCAGPLRAGFFSYTHVNIVLPSGCLNRTFATRAFCPRVSERYRAAN